MRRSGNTILGMYNMKLEVRYSGDMNIYVDNKTKAYGEPNPEFTGTVTRLIQNPTNPGETVEVDGLIGTDTITSVIGSYNCNLNSPVGTYTGTATGWTATNMSHLYYDPTKINFVYSDPADPSAPSPGHSTLTVVKRDITVTANNKSSEYRQGLKDLDFSITSGSLVEGDTLTDLGVTLSTNADNTVIADYQITGSAVSTNYNVTVNPGTYSITPKTIIVDIDDKSSADGEPIVTDLTFTVNSATQLEDGDNADVLKITLTKAVGTAVGNYAITGSQGAGASDKYTVVFNEGVYKVLAIVTFQDYQHTTIGTENVEYGTSATATGITVPNRPGYEHVGWDPAITNVTESMITTATYSLINYNINYTNVDGAEHSNPNTYTTVDTIVLADASKAGHTFVGWTFGESGSPQKGLTIGPNETGEKTIKAHWSVNNYDVTVKVNTTGYGKVDGENTVTVTDVPYGTSYSTSGNKLTISLPTARVVEAVATTNTPQYTYAFLGWDSNSGTTGTDTTITANFSRTPVNYTISFEENGGTTVADITQGYGTAVSEPTKPTRTGHTFKNWYSNPGLTDVFNFSGYTMPANNVTVYVDWTINQYTMSFNTNGGNAIGDITQDYNSDITPPSDPTKEGHTFAGWFSDSELTNSYTISKMPAENKTIYAKWTVNNYSVKVNVSTIGYGKVDGGNEVTVTDVPYGTSYSTSGKNLTISLPTARVIAALEETDTDEWDYTFTGWDPTSGTTGINTTITANFTRTKKTYLVTVQAGENGSLTGYAGHKSYEYGTAIDGSTAALKIGGATIATATPNTNTAEWKYSFVEWTGIPSTDKVNGVLTIVAQFKKEKQVYPVTVKVGATSEGFGQLTNYTGPYSVEYGTVISSNVKVLSIGDSITVNAEENLDTAQYDYEFIGWSGIPSGDGKVTNAVTVHASFSRTTKSYTVTFKNHLGNTIGTPQTIEYGKDAVAETAPSRTGYTFSQWSHSFTNVQDNVVTTAQYTANKYNVTFDVDGGAAKASKEVTYDAPYVLGETTKNGYTFK
ncbi:MAG TPA: InlB B-repeat-containing protein, partial [Clostridia bacterium]|nr:InlB B-repeat-containing protein [Clostridia bacterium]